MVFLVIEKQDAKITLNPKYFFHFVYNQLGLKPFKPITDYLALQLQVPRNMNK